MLLYLIRLVAKSRVPFKKILRLFLVDSQQVLNRKISPLKLKLLSIHFMKDSILIFHNVVLGDGIQNRTAKPSYINDGKSSWLQELRNQFYKSF